MPKTNLGKLGLAAVILLAPGGFVLGATLAARALKARADDRRKTGAARPE